MGGVFFFVKRIQVVDTGEYWSVLKLTVINNWKGHCTEGLYKWQSKLLQKSKKYSK